MGTTLQPKVDTKVKTKEMSEDEKEAVRLLRNVFDENRPRVERVWEVADFLWHYDLRKPQSK